MYSTSVPHLKENSTPRVPHLKENSTPRVPHLKENSTPRVPHLRSFVPYPHPQIVGSPANTTSYGGVEQD